MSLKSEIVAGYYVTELTLRQMRDIRREDMSADELQDAMGIASTHKPDGSPITAEEWGELGFSRANAILLAVARLNAADGEPGEDGGPNG